MADDPRHGGIGRALHDLGKSVAALPGRPGRNVLSGPPAGLFACARISTRRGLSRTDGLERQPPS